MAYRSFQARSWVGAAAAGLHYSHSNVVSLTHWPRPGIEPVSSWILVGLVSSDPQRNFFFFFFFFFLAGPVACGSSLTRIKVTPQQQPESLQWLYTGSLTHCTTREPQNWNILYPLNLMFKYPPVLSTYIKWSQFKGCHLVTFLRFLLELGQVWWCNFQAPLQSHVHLNSKSG